MGKIKVTKIKATVKPDTEISSMDPDMETKNIPETDMAKMTTDTNKILMDQNRAMDTKRSPITITITKKDQNRAMDIKKITATSDLPTKKPLWRKTRFHEILL